MEDKLVELHHEPQIQYRWSPVQSLDRCSEREGRVVGEHVLNQYRGPNVRVLQEVIYSRSVSMSDSAVGFEQRV